ncbi:MAG: ABC transporter ATP-binding protein [Deltaproteobacteria bacterium]|nr:ABC transporter ATP-binding protein [Deltaproteobacteria bacterium]
MPLKASRLTKRFGTEPKPILDDLSFEIQDGEFVSLTGKSGSGKSSLLYLISSLDKPSSGQIWIDGLEISALADHDLHELRNQKIGFIFQFHYLLPELTVLENILMPAVKTKQQKTKRAYAQEILEHFGLGDKQNRLPSQLSGGEQQRVAIARALIMNPRYLFADEPTGSLDSVNGEKVMQILKDINSQQKMTLILVTHDPDFASYADRQIHLADGRIV